MRLHVGNSECLAWQLEMRRNSDISKQFSHILYNKVRFFVAYRVKEKYSRTLQTIFLACVSIFCQISNQRFTIWLPKPGHQVSVTSLLPALPLFSKVWLNLTLLASTPHPKPTPMWPTFSTTLLWMLITMFWPQLMQVTWPLRQGQGPFTVHQVLPVLAPLRVLPSLTPTHLSHLLPLQGISLPSSGWNTWSFP